MWFQKCLQFHQEDTVWSAKERVLATMATVSLNLKKCKNLSLNIYVNLSSTHVFSEKKLWWVNLVRNHSWIVQLAFIDAICIFKAMPGELSIIMAWGGGGQVEVFHDGKKYYGPPPHSNAHKSLQPSFEHVKYHCGSILCDHSVELTSILEVEYPKMFSLPTMNLQIFCSPPKFSKIFHDLPISPPPSQP